MGGVVGVARFGVYWGRFVSDATCCLFGGVIGALGLAGLPRVIAYPFSTSGPLITVTKGLGVLACVALVVGGALLVGGSTGLLGHTAPSWLPGAPPYGAI